MDLVVNFAYFVKHLWIADIYFIKTYIFVKKSPLGIYVYTHWRTCLCSTFDESHIILLT